MDSLEIFHIRQKYFLGSYQPLIAAELPDKLSPDYLPTIIFKARGQVQSNPDAALALLPTDDESLPVKSIRALATYFKSKQSDDESSKEKALEELRDLCVEIEGDDIEEDVKGTVRTVAAVAFVHEGETEEALETLGAGSSTRDLEALALTVQLYLAMHRLDLAQKEFDKAKAWAEDDLLLQLIEASVGLVSGVDSYSNPYSFYNEHAHNPSLTSGHVVTAKGLTQLLRGDIREAEADFTEALKLDPTEVDALAGKVITEWLSGNSNKSEASFTELREKHPNYPLVKDWEEKSQLFDSLVSKYQVPPLAKQA